MSKEICLSKKIKRSTTSKRNETINHKKITRKKVKRVSTSVHDGALEIKSKNSNCRWTNAKVFLPNVSRNSHLCRIAFTTRAHFIVIEAKTVCWLYRDGRTVEWNFITRSRVHDGKSYLPTWRALQHQLRILESHIFAISVGLADERFPHTHTLTVLSFFPHRWHMLQSHSIGVSFRNFGSHVLDTINRKFFRWEELHIEPFDVDFQSLSNDTLNIFMQRSLIQ